MKVQYKPIPIKQHNALIKSEAYKYRNIAKNNDYVWDIAWMLNPSSMNETINNYIRDYNGLIKVILELPEYEKTFENTFALFDDFVTRMHFDVNKVIFLQHVSTNEVIREVSAEAEKKLNEFNIGLSMRNDLYELAQKIWNAEEKSLIGEDRRFLEDQLRAYKRNGLNLDEEVRDKVKTLNEELSNLCTEFALNIAKDNTTIQFTRQELDGLPDMFFASLSQPLDANEDIEGPTAGATCGIDNTNEGGDGEYTLTAKYPHVFPVLEKANSEETRRKMDVMYNSRCKENMAILHRIIELRGEIAKTLGYTTWAEYALEINMAKSPAVVRKFLSKLAEKLEPLRDRELTEMATKKGSAIGQHDWRYYLDQEKIEKYQVDSDIVREYFPLNNVLVHMFRYFERLLGFRFVRGLKESWHSDAWEWVVYDLIENRIIGKFYLDLFPRDNKFTHAACFSLKYATHSDPYAVCAMVCNFSAATPDMPSLLTHAEVETLYHEFGHVMHNICARTYYVEFSGTQTDRDFVEAPSQMLENWCWEFSTIKELSKHYKNGEQMPDEMIHKLIATRYVGSGITNCRQLTLGIADQLLHTESFKTPDELEATYNQVCERIMGVPNAPDTFKLAIFGHIAGGYDAQYYGYMWSLVYASDMYEHLKKELKSDPKAGLRYRKIILECGGSRDAYDTVKEFLGREPDNAAFLRGLGL